LIRTVGDSVASVTGSQYSYASDHGASAPQQPPAPIAITKKSLVGSKPPQLPAVGLDLISNFNLMEEKQKIEKQINDQQEKWEKGLKLTLQTRKTVGPESSPHIRQKYVLSMMGTASKIKRMVISNENSSIINVNLKAWETKR
jgi:hypothetical protein